MKRNIEEWRKESRLLVKPSFLTLLGTKRTKKETTFSPKDNFSIGIFFLYIF
jgi:hypothetical protein